MTDRGREPDGMATVGQALAAAASRLAVATPDVAVTARLDAELLLGFVLGVERTRILAYPEAPIGTGQAEQLAALVARRSAGEPVAYLRGLAEFHGLALAVDPRVLVPRPETEQLVDLALEEIARRLVGSPRPAGAPPVAVVDVGTGSGAIAVALAVTLRRLGMAGEVAITASDRSADAIGVARENAASHAVADLVGMIAADLLPPAGATAGLRSVPASFEVVCANLPYIRTVDLPGLPAPVRFEPVESLDGGMDGLDVIRALLATLAGRTLPGAVALLEIGADQAGIMREAAAERLPGWTVEILDDLAGLPRVARLRRPGPAVSPGRGPGGP